MSIKKVIILAYDFPPINSIGAQRPYSWYTYFPLFGIHPIVVTRSFSSHSDKLEDAILDGIKCEIEHSDGKTLVRVCSTKKGNPLWSPVVDGPALKRKVRTGFNVASNYLGVGQGDILNIFRAAAAIASSQEINFVIATGEPFSLFKYAERLAKRIGCEWAADYRDSWSTNTAIDYSVFHRATARLFEKKWTKSAKFITTAAKSYRENLKAIHLSKPIHVVYNGFFEEYFENLPNGQTDKDPQLIIIGYLGTLYDHQPLEEFVGALRVTMSQWNDKKVKFIFFGAQNRSVIEKRIKGVFQGLDVELTLTKQLEHKEVLRQASRLDALLLLTDPERPMLYAKVFDYLALQRPILNYRPDKSDIDSILADMEGVYSCDNPDEVSRALHEIASNGRRVLTNDISLYARKEQARVLARMMLDAS